MIRNARAWWSGRQVRRAQRRYWTAAATLGQQRTALAREAADVAISRARCRTAAGERVRVDVADVLGVAAGSFGMVGRAAVHPVDAAEALRERICAGRLDLDTDAHESRYRAADLFSIAWGLTDTHTEESGR
ncbi:hypothetical protein [Streptomyces sp. NPDC012510]|uniref:hypothetical protein n=1 Tax=Streptomyces sp. NPDC012510 TaxID=3364838 RepID=UPI0036F0E022